MEVYVCKEYQRFLVCAEQLPEAYRAGIQACMVRLNSSLWQVRAGSKPLTCLLRRRLSSTNEDNQPAKTRLYLYSKDGCHLCDGLKVDGQPWSKVSCVLCLPKWLRKIAMSHMQEKFDAILWRAQFMQTPLSGATLEVCSINLSSLLKVSRYSSDLGFGNNIAADPGAGHYHKARVVGCIQLDHSSVDRWKG